MISAIGPTARHFGQEVLPRVTAYGRAENKLSDAARNHGFDKDAIESIEACSAAFDLAVALDGLADRLAHERDLPNRRAALAEVRPLCRFATVPRPEALYRNTGIAVAYKHYSVSDPNLPVNGLEDILCAGLGYGLDGFGVGKIDGPEVIVWDRGGIGWKYLGDAAAVLAGWSMMLSTLDGGYRVSDQLYLGLPLPS